MFLLCYFLIPRKPTVKYIDTVLNAHDTADDNTTVKFTESTCAQSRARARNPRFTRSHVASHPHPESPLPPSAPRTDKLQNNDYFSVEWSDPKLTISYYNKNGECFTSLGRRGATMPCLIPC